MKITKKATVALGQHQAAAYGMFQTKGEQGSTITCSCGENLKFNYKDMPDGEFDTMPYLHGLMAIHQIERMEQA